MSTIPEENDLTLVLWHSERLILEGVVAFDLFVHSSLIMIGSHNHVCMHIIGFSNQQNHAHHQLLMNQTITSLP